MQIGIGMCIVVIECLYMQGNLQQIGNLIDVVINGNGFFQVQMFDGMLVYMCDGSFQINVQGQFVILSGYLVQLVVMVLQNVISLIIGKDGVVMVIMLGMVNNMQVGMF